MISHIEFALGGAFVKHRHSSAKTALSSLKSSQSGSGLLQAVEQSIALQKILKAWPAMRGVTFQAGPIKQSTLVLYVGNPAALARIKHSVPSLLARLQEHGWLLQKITVRVHTLSSKPPEMTRPKRAVMSDKGLQAWRQLQDKLHDPDLLQATSQLTKRRGP